MLTSNPTQYSDFVYYVGSAISWLVDVFEGLVDTIFSNWLIAGFLYTIIFLTIFSLVLWFIDDVTDASSEYTLMKHRKIVREAAAEEKHKQRLSEAEERYQKHKEQNRAEAAERYRNRNSEPILPARQFWENEINVMMKSSGVSRERAIEILKSSPIYQNYNTGITDIDEKNRYLHENF